MKGELSMKEVIIINVAIGLILVALAITLYWFTPPKEQKQPSEPRHKIEVEKEPSEIKSPLNPLNKQIEEGRE
jgi:flagellar basal body-associated protein FliL